jgi:ADP-ribosylglycohydrolase
MFDVRGMRSQEAYRGCLLGGAVGDALGAPIEFMRLDEIRRRFGPAGVAELEPAYGRRGAITDDTQMTLFTAEALLRALHRFADRGLVSLTGVARGSYLRWLATQGEPAQTFGDDGWLLGVRELYARRGPGNTCLTALREGGRGTRERPLNDSKGCGGVMRVAPVGLARFEDPFAIASELAAITHGHPTGQLAAGYLAQVVADVVGGAELRDAAYGAIGRLVKEPGHEETVDAVEAALGLAARGAPSPAAVESLGEGWIAEEALAIGLYCALVARDFEHGVLLAVNHGGDSDSTGSIAGNLLGLLAGEQGIPPQWLERLELRDVIATVADDLWAHFGVEDRGGCGSEARYPPN